MERYGIAEWMDGQLEELRGIKIENGIMSAQRAEIMALTEACRILEGEKGTIFTDSAYGFGVCHYYGKIWARNKFRKTNGKPIKHEKEIRDLLQSCLGPTELSIVKCDAHQKGITLGIVFADQTAKAAAKRETEPGKGILVLTRAQIAKKTECIQIRRPEEIIKEQQKQAGEQEKLEWKLRGANEVGEIWRTAQGQVVVTEQLEQMVMSQAHGAGHNNRTEMIDTIIKQNNMWFPRMQRKLMSF